MKADESTARPRVGVRCALCACAVCALAAAFLQRGGRVEAAGEVKGAMIVSLLGGFRGMAAEFVWFRADRLQDAGRYTELAQLSYFLTQLDPHTPEVWSYASWNLAYNISVMMASPADRWRWVQAGLKLLRDDGVRINPRSAALHRELAWMFSMKIGGAIDDASPYYRERWREIVAAAGGDWAGLGMDKAKMAAVEAEYGPQDWSDAQASGLYWAAAGLEFATGEERRRLRDAVCRALVAQALDNPARVRRALRELESFNAEFPSRQLQELVQAFRERIGAAAAPPSAGP